MTMPGFTAEVSLYPTSGHYRLVRTHGQADGAIHPGQLSIPPWPRPCYTCCPEFGLGPCRRVCPGPFPGPLGI